jgi:putative ABC transport system ATP-binding protein
MQILSTPPQVHTDLLLQAQIMRGIGAGQRVFELLDRAPVIPPESGVPVPPAHERVGTVRFERVGFSYPSRKAVEVLKDFSLEIGTGESVALV